MNAPHLTTSDTERISTQLNRVETLMSDGNWRTLREIAQTVNGSEAGVSARLRDCRNKLGYIVNRRRENERGLYSYQVLEPIQAFKYEENGQAIFL